MDDLIRERVGGRGPILSDGTSVRSLVDLNKFEVAMRTVSDPEIHRLDLKKIFVQSWIGVGLEWEIPNAGDFVKRFIGEDQVIVTRGRDGEIAVLLNVCSHRGMEICWADHGNQASFKCPYHGWVFDHAGNLLGAPFEKEMYGDWDKSQYGLRKARVTVRRGLIFATFGDNVIPLDEWMGDFLWYFDMAMDGMPEMVALSAGARAPIDANWKVIADQLSGDGYHGMTTHWSLCEIGFRSPDVPLDYWFNNVKMSFPEGHACFSFNPMSTPRLKPDGTLEGSRPPDKSLLEGDNRYVFDPTKHSGGRIWSLHMFPCTQINGMVVTLPDGTKMASAMIGGLVPHGVNRCEIWGASAVAKSKVGTSAVKEDRRLNSFGSVVGMLVGIDDAEQWPSVQRASTGVMGQEQPMRYFAQLGINKPKDWPGPGNVHAGYSKDDGQWSFWKRWLAMMTAE